MKPFLVASAIILIGVVVLWAGCELLVQVQGWN